MCSIFCFDELRLGHGVVKSARTCFGGLGVAISVSITGKLRGCMLISDLLQYIISNRVIYCRESLRGKFLLNYHVDLALSKVNELGPVSWLCSFKFLR